MGQKTALLAKKLESYYEKKYNANIKFNDNLDMIFDCVVIFLKTVLCM